MDKRGEGQGQAAEGVHAHEQGSPTATTIAGGGGPRGREFVAGVDLALPFALRPADDLRTPFTNHVKGYQGLLDYIWWARQPGDGGLGGQHGAGSTAGTARGLACCRVRRPSRHHCQHPLAHPTPTPLL